jgi:hypothetical protein
MRALIPRYAPTWTDHNDSDPGITLLQLFAWLAEAMIYRLNRIPKASEAQFIKLLLGASGPDLDAARVEAVQRLRARWRAITAADFEALVLDDGNFEAQGLPAAAGRVARARCLPERDLAAADPDTPRPGHVSVIIVPRSTADQPQPSPELLAAADHLLDERRLLTTRHHVSGPGYTDVGAVVEVARTSQVQDDTVRDAIVAALRRFFHPLTGGPDGQGWPFGRHVYASEVYQVIESVSGVDHVESLSLRKDGAWADPRDEVTVPANNLVHYVVEAGDVRVMAYR